MNLRSITTSKLTGLSQRILTTKPQYETQMEEHLYQRISLNIEHQTQIIQTNFYILVGLMTNATIIPTYIKTIVKKRMVLLYGLRISYCLEVDIYEMKTCQIVNFSGSKNKQEVKNNQEAKKDLIPNLVNTEIGCLKNLL